MLSFRLLKTTEGWGRGIARALGQFRVVADALASRVPVIV